MENDDDLCNQHKRTENLTQRSVTTAKKQHELLRGYIYIGRRLTDTPAGLPGGKIDYYIKSTTQID